jgi:20S proteasome alpha/beta subunit
MSNISNQLIKDSYNYVLQSDLVTGVVYRIGGDVPTNPKFISGLTINSTFTYSDGSEFDGYVLTCDASGNATWAPVSATTSGIFVTGGTFNYTTGTLQLRNSNGSQVTISGLTDTYVTGGTISGTSVIFTYNDGDTFELSGITPYSLFSSYTATTQVTINNKLDISGFTSYTASTQPLILNSITGGTYSGGTLYLINNSGSTIPITGFTTGITDSYVTGFSLNNETITLSQNRVDQYSAFNISLSGYVTNNVFSSYTASTQSNINNKLDISGFTAYTATTQPLILNSVTGGTYSGGTLYLVNNSGTTIPISGFTTGGTSTTDSYVTGFTLDNDVITLTQNRIDQYSAFSVSLSGYVSNLIFTSYTASTEGILNSKVDNTTFNQFAQDTNIAINNRVEIPTFTAYTATTQPLILNAVTGGTYSGGTLYLINNSGTTIPISGFTTGGTSTTDSYVTGFSLNNETITLSQNRIDQYSAFNISLSGYVTNNIFSSYTASTQSTINNKLDTSGFTAYTATTQPLILNSVTGGTYSSGTLYLVNNSGNTVQITGFSTSSSGGSSNLQYYISGSTPTGIINSGDRWFNTQTGIELVYINDGDSQQWVQPFSVPGPAGQDLGVYSTTGITSSQTITWDKTYWGISGSTNVDLSLPTTVGKDGYYLIIKDESGICGNYRIRLTPSIGLIDGNNYVDMNINYMSLTCMVRGGNWYLI